jgi:adenylate cyclase
MLSLAYTQTSFYVARELLGEKDYRMAAALLQVAVGIHDGQPVIWYNLACALARTGQREEALDALEKAVERGFSDREQLAGDADLASLRESERYRALVARLASGG